MKKRIICILCLLAVSALTAACGKTETAPTAESAPTAAAAAAPETAVIPETAVSAAPVTEAAVPETDAPVQPDDEADDDTPSSVFDINALTGNSWTLTKVIIDGEETAPAVYYGSVIRQTGATIVFNYDGTFRSVIGLKGCSGDYTADSSGVFLHVTEIFTGAFGDGEPCDETVVVICDAEAGTIRFDLFGATNIFQS